MMTRVKPVIISIAAGRNDSEVSSSSVCTGSDQIWPPPGAGLLMTPGSAWAQAGAGTSAAMASIRASRDSSGPGSGRRSAARGKFMT
ncbi:hypothetical protein D9M72_450830 [compost metagenome]